MLHIHNVMINSSLSLGVPLQRWTTSEVIMIPKEPNNIQINRLRVINLYEADYNLLLKFFWSHKATQLADKLGLLGENQWGTKPLCSAEQPALMDEFITEIHRITCRNMAKLQNDATACYDRMISNLTSLVSRSYHVPDNAYKIQAHALKAMKYKVITALGISEDHHSHSTSFPIHGTGQGSGSSGTNWLFNSVPMMKLISQICNGLEIISPDKQITWTKHILGLVDDARQYSNDWKKQ